MDQPKAGLFSTSISPIINHEHMISYFVSHTATDGLPAGDIKSINKSAKHLYDCGHAQNVEIVYKYN